jgi:hypothetical protein
MRAEEFVFEKKKISKPTQSQCEKPRNSLSAVRYSQCVSLGMKAHQSDHTDGTGKQGVKGSGKPLRGRKAKSERHGGPVKDYSGPTRGGPARRK